MDHVSIYDYWPVDPDTGEFSNEGVKISWGYYTAPVKDTSLFAVTYESESAIQITNQTITDKIKEIWANLLTAESEEACESYFLEQREIYSGDIQKLEEYVKEQHESNMEKFNSD